MFFILTFPNKVHYETTKKRSPVCACNRILQLVPTKGVREWGTSWGKMKKQCLCLALAKPGLTADKGQNLNLKEEMLLLQCCRSTCEK